MMMRVGCDEKGEKTTEKFVCVVCVCVCVVLLGRKVCHMVANFGKRNLVESYISFLSRLSVKFFSARFFLCPNTCPNTKEFL